MESRMEYCIKNPSGDAIAWFVNECDRDYALDALNEAFDIDPDDVANALVAADS